MKIVVLDGFTLNPGDLSWEGISELGSLKVYDRVSGRVEEVIAAIGDAEVVFTNKTPLPLEVLEGTPFVKYIGVLATGYNVVDISTARRLGMIVTNVPDYGTAEVAQYTMALLLELCHQVGLHDRAVKTGEWSFQPDFSFWKQPLVSLSGKTMGIIGMGRIGKATAHLAKAFGMQVIYAARQGSIHREMGYEQVSLGDLLEQSDVISLHCPLTEATQAIINKENIGKMKHGVMLINTARGQLVVEEDLYEALGQGKIAGAALDVVSSEPIKEGNPLLKAKNCIITPHIAWASVQSRSRLMQIAVDNLKAYLKGSPINVVNC